MFRCLVMRHAEAEDQAATGMDADRSLTARGAARIHRIAAGLASQLPPSGTLFCSPYLRARQTAEALAQAFRISAPTQVDVLAAGASPDQIMHWLADNLPEGDVILVGHEPDMGRFVSYALAASSRGFYALHPGEACLLEFPVLPRAGNATLEWAMEPGQLERLAASRV